MRTGPCRAHRHDERSGSCGGFAPPSPACRLRCGARRRRHRFECLSAVDAGGFVLRELAGMLWQHRASRRRNDGRTRRAPRAPVIRECRRHRATCTVRHRARAAPTAVATGVARGRGIVSRCTARDDRRHHDRLRRRRPAPPRGNGCQPWRRLCAARVARAAATDSGAGTSVKAEVRSDAACARVGTARRLRTCCDHRPDRARCARQRQVRGARMSTRTAPAAASTA